MKNRIWPWLCLLCVCVCIAAFSVFRLVTQQPSELSQQPTTQTGPTDRSEEKFAALFENPDWKSLYSQACIQDTPFENADTFASYMTARVGQTPLTCRQVQSNLPDARRYLVFCGSDKIASYHLVLPQYHVADLQLYFDRSISVTIQSTPDHTVFVNGVALDDAYTVKTLQTKAEQYLPDELHGKRLRWQTVSDLLCEPVVTAQDTAGNEVALTRNPQTGVYEVPMPKETAITQAQIDFLTGAGIADARFAIGEISKADLANFFDPSGDLYQMLVTNPRNLQKYTSSSVEDITVSQFAQYSDTLYSANVKLTQKIIRKTGTLKIYTMDKTYFFMLQENGEYLVTAYTNEHVTDTVETVRLTFITGTETAPLYVDTVHRVINAPTIDADNFVGWASRHDEADGTVTYIVRILPDGTFLGNFVPMDLYPIYQ